MEVQIVTNSKIAFRRHLFAYGARLLLIQPRIQHLREKNNFHGKVSILWCFQFCGVFNCVVFLIVWCFQLCGVFNLVVFSILWYFQFCGIFNLVMFSNQFHCARSCVARDLTPSWTARRSFPPSSWSAFPPFFQAFLLTLFLFSAFPLLAFLFRFLLSFVLLLLLPLQLFPPQALPFLFTVLWFSVALLAFFGLLGAFLFTASELKQ